MVINLNNNIENILNELYIEAQKAFSENEIPVSAIIVKDGKIIWRAHNEKEKYNCCTKHAEINCIEKVSSLINDWRLNEFDIYISMEPCLMCLGAIEQSRIKNVYYLLGNNLYGSLGNNKINLGNIDTNLIKIDNVNYEEKFKYLLKSFFDNKR